MKTKGQKIVIKFVLSYIAILVIPIAIGSITYNYAYKAVEESTQKAMFYSLDQTKSVLEQRFDEISTMTYQLNKNTFAQRFSYEQGGITGQIPSKLLEVQNRLPDYAISNKFILDYFIFFPKTKVVLNKNIVYDYNNFYANYLSYNNIEYSTWLEKINDDHSVDTYWKNQPISIASTGIPTALAAVKRPSSAMTCFSRRGKSYEIDMHVMMLVSAEALETVTGSNIQSSNDYVGIVSADDNLLYETAPRKAYSEYSISVKNKEVPRQTYTDFIDGQKVFVTYSHSKELDWSFISIKPYETVMAKLIAVQKSIIAVIALSFLVGIVAAVILSVKKNSPAMLLINDNKQLQHELDANKPVMENSFLERLLNGSLSETDLKSTLNYLEIQEISDYRAFVIQFFDNNELDIEYFEKIKVIIENLLKERAIPKTYFHDIGAFKLAFIADCHHWDFENDTAKQCLKDICDELQEIFPCKIAVSVGNIYQNISQIQLSVLDALWLLDRKAWDKPYQIMLSLSHDIFQPSVEPGGKLDLQHELQQLQNCIKGGFDTEASVVFDSTRSLLLQSQEDNVSGQNSAYVFIFTMLNFLEGSVASYFSENLQFAQEIHMAGKDILSNSLSDVLHQLKKLCITASNLFSLYNTEKKENAFDQIIVYIKENYANSMLSLTMIAEQSGISESYLSRQFKKYIGENISNYIEDVRLEKAAELLNGNKDLNVQQIAGEVGYNSPNTFNKAFNKKYGISPSAYRNMQT